MYGIKANDRKRIANGELGRRAKWRNREAKPGHDLIAKTAALQRKKSFDNLRRYLDGRRNVEDNSYRRGWTTWIINVGRGIHGAHYRY